jgi:hypothetical protein
MGKIGAYSLLFFLLLGFASLTFVKAEEAVDDEDVDVFEDDKVDEETYTDEYEEEEDDGVLRAHADVDVVYTFPEYPNEHLVIGKPISLLILFSNNGETPLNITEVGAHLQSQYDLSYYIQNYSKFTQNLPVRPHEQVSLEYLFMPDEMLEPMGFWFSAYVHYNNTEGRQYRTTFMNHTLELIEDPNAFQYGGLLTLIALLGAAAVGAYVYMAPPAKKSSSDSAPVKDDWGPVYKRGKDKPVRKKNTPKAKHTPKRVEKTD